MTAKYLIILFIGFAIAKEEAMKKDSEANTLKQIEDNLESLISKRKALDNKVSDDLKPSSIVAKDKPAEVNDYISQYNKISQLAIKGIIAERELKDAVSKFKSSTGIKAVQGNEDPETCDTCNKCCPLVFLCCIFKNNINAVNTNIKFD